MNGIVPVEYFEISCEVHPGDMSSKHSATIAYTTNAGRKNFPIECSSRDFKNDWAATPEWIGLWSSLHPARSTRPPVMPVAINGSHRSLFDPTHVFEGRGAPSFFYFPGASEAAQALEETEELRKEIASLKASIATV